MRPAHTHQSSDAHSIPTHVRQQLATAATASHIESSSIIGQRGALRTFSSGKGVREWLRRLSRTWRLPALIFAAAVTFFGFLDLDQSRSKLLRPIYAQSSSKHTAPNDDFVRCPPQKPNLILSSNDGHAKVSDMFKFMHSLDLAVGLSLSEARNDGSCPPGPPEVKIIVPEAFAKFPTSEIKLLLDRHPNLEFVGRFDQHYPQWNPMYTRFIAWREYAEANADRYDKLWVGDLDIIFQRDPFTMPLNGSSMIVYGEWQDLAIGDDIWDLKWLNECAANEILSQSDIAT